uniref:Rho GTPase activating protein 39 n=1 Tax=Echinococcus granulosus TaxID=6210 RepID=A0A068W6Y8_ECHGR|nr:rho GTPase activating protein 39 [Echinococcus granulosus]
MDSKSSNQDLLEWVELLEPSSQKVIFANLESGEIRWDSPPDAQVRPLASEQWWELYDMNTQRHYYHNVRSGRTEWHRPSSGDVIPLSNLQLIKQFANSGGTMDKDIGVMHRYRLCPTGGARNSIHMTPQDHRKMSSPVSATPPVSSRHPVAPSPGRPVSHRRRNSQPTHSAPAVTCHASLQQQSLTRCAAASSLSVTANQRVTEWLRSAGSLPEEAEDEATYFQHQKAFASSVATQTPQTRWNTARGIPTTVFQPHPPLTTRRTVSNRQMSPSITTPYDRRIVSMVPAPPPPPPLHGRTSVDSNAAVIATQESAFANLLYDMSCNVVTPQHQQQQNLSTTAVNAEMAALALTPRAIPRTNPHAVVTAGTMPRLSSAKPHLPSLQPPLPIAVVGATVGAPTKLKNGTGAVSVTGVVSSSPDTEITTNSASASASASYSSDSEPEEKEPQAMCKEAPMSANDVSTYSKEDIFEQHPFRPAADLPVDEYTFTVPRQQQQCHSQAIFHNQHCLPETHNNWSLLSHQHQQQPHSMVLMGDADQAPPTPPPRLASAMNTMQLSRVPRTTSAAATTTLPVDSATWQNLDIPLASGFLPRNHPFRQPLKQPSYTNPALNTVASAEDDTPEDSGLIHTSTRSLLSASSSAHEGAGGGTTGSTHSPFSTSAAPLHPRRSASGGFIGPADSEVASLSSSSATATAARPSFDQPTSVVSTSATIACSGSTHFALISGPYLWPKNLLRQGQDCTALMSWTKVAFSKRLLAATDKSLQKHISENFKLIQSFMGDRSAKLSKPDLASIIVQRALSTPGVRDELYAQLCKQTTGNYNADSLMRGWELICICLYFFPPNKVFRDPLHAYLTTRSEALSIALAPPPLSSSISSTAANATNDTPALRPGPSLAAAAALAAGSDPTGLIAAPVTPAFGVPLADTGGGGGENICETSADPALSSEFPYGPWVKLSALHFTRAAPRWFMRSVALGAVRSSIPPSKEELLHVKDFLLKPGIFGSSLEEMMKIQSCRFPSLRLPWIQIFLTEELLRLNGAKAEGIFRVSADQDVLTSVRFQLEKLFEVFRVLEVASRDPISTFTIVRPPPRGWSHSQQVFSPEPASTTLSAPTPTTPTHNALLHCPALTGPFSLPLKPSPIPSRPAEYMLLTPRSLWPGDLTGFREAAGGSTAVGCGGSEKGSFLDPHLAAALLKLWLREMATPLVPPALTVEVFAAAVEAESFEKSVGAAVPGAEPIEKCCAMVRRLPGINRRVLLYLIKLCQHLVRPENACTSLMDARNLATVIAPNLFRSASNNPSELLNSVQSQTAFTRLLICHLNVDAEAALLNASAVEADYEVETVVEDVSYNHPPPPH